MTLQPFNLQGRLTLTFFGLVSLVVGALSIVLFMAARDQGMADLRQRLGDIVGVAAARLDADLHIRIQPELGMDAEAYRRMKAALQAVRDGASDLRFVYTMRQDGDGTIRFVVDAEEDPADLSPLGSVYDDASALLRERFAKMDGPVVETEVYTDRWGTWLSGYAPIRTGDGAQVGVLAADISAATVRGYQRRLLWIAAVTFVGILPFIIMGGWWMGRTISRPIVALNQGARRIAEGDLEVRLNSVRRDEIGTLARSFDRMAASLAQGRRQIEQVAAKYRAIFDNAAEGIFQSTLDGRLVDANRALLDMLGYPELERIQAEVQDLAQRIYVDPADRAALLARLREAGSVAGFEVQLRRADGTSFWAEMSVHRVETEQGAGLLEGMLLDVTERRRRQQAEREREAAQAANEAKSGFLANMSHEIRTPLNAIMGLADLLSRTALDDRQRSYLAKIRASSGTLLTVINDILDLSKIEAGRLDLESTAFSLDEVLADLTEMFAYRAHERDIELLISADADVPRALIGDPVRLGQILINLTGNALKFTERGEVVVTVSRVEAPPSPLDADQIMVRFAVRDTGPGIPEDRLDAILEPFSQADGSITRQHGGTGLGLAIVRHLAGLMGGGLQVESRLGQGSTFTATLVLRCQPERHEDQPVTPVDLRGLKVLVVEDNATSREILVSQIRSFQMEATAVPSGEAALAHLAEPGQTFDLVLLDWKMPGLNGLETARRIRADLKLEKTPVVCMISAYAREDLMQQSERAVLDAFLHKPVNQSFLFDTIMSLFGHQVGRPPRPAALAAAAPPDFSGRRVLLVEDIDINRLVAMEWLSSVGLEIDTAENGAEALDLADPSRHDAILMDVQMPVMDGLEATRRLRAMPGRESLPIIAMTAHALKGDLERCLAAGMNDYVPKPVDPSHLFATLARWIQPQVADVPHGPARLLLGPASGAVEDSAIAGLHLPGIDLADGLARANRNAALYLRMLQGLRRTLGDLVRTTEAQLAAGLVEEGRRAVHSVKGVAGNLGARTLHERAEAAERLIAAGSFSPDAAAWQAFVAALDEVREGLIALPVEMGTAAGAPPDGRPDLAGEALGRALRELVAQLDDDLEQAREQIEILKPALQRRFGPARVARLQARIEDFDIDAAIGDVRAMVEEGADDDQTG